MEPIITEITLPMKESAPYFPNKSVAMAREPDPDTGRSKAKGRASFGNRIVFATGESSFAIKSIAPEALKTLIKFVSDSTDEVFMTEFNTHFDKESVIRYYIFVMVMGLVDSLGKNAKLVTYDGIKWYFEFYDMDTSLGLDNTGAVKYDVDIEMNPDEFNTSESRFWT